MLRRQFLIGASALLALPITRVPAQAPQHARVGILVDGPRPTVQGPSLFSSLMGKLGWVEGRNLTIERRYADGQLARLPELASELVRLGVQVILALDQTDAEAARRATRSIPIVIFFALDPVKTGLAQSLARPGGNVTGVMWADTTFAAKSIQILKEAVPGIKRLGLLYAVSSGVESYYGAIRKAAQTLGVTVVELPVTHHEQVAATLTKFKKEGIDALRVGSLALLRPAWDQILEFIVANKLPSIFAHSWGVENGGLLSLAPKESDTDARVAAMVDKILRGANPADMPFEYPTRYELTINLKTAKALGLNIPQSILLRADRVIE